ncbi:hypothetical protein Clacol_006146 [Clathrus columnatus]|uniref:Uncharacterized protein n=1 Tax=Clathrus columnatus TaxID=1419009 RepID=A0AAV5AGU3_9AGAM|nr:hypothetical protein Clacol_006146 [Clathrus columnatus]
MASTISIPQLNFAANTYLTVYLSPSSPYLSGQHASLNSIHPDISHVGPLGVLNDVHIISAAKEDWGRNDIREDILAALQPTQDNGIIKFEVLKEPQQRTKRNDEL